MRTNNKPSDSTATFHGGTSRASEPYRDVCGKCGARRIDSQLGLEATPEEFVAAMVRVFREVWRVLRDDGTAWVNLGDSFAQTTLRHRGGAPGTNRSDYLDNSRSTVVGGLKPKDLCGIPWRVAFALQADGWYLRSDIIWSKPNPMPESVTDRPTKSHEYVFLLSKRERYYFDQEAVREKTIPDARDARWNERNGKGRTDHENDLTQGMMQKHRPDWIRMSNPAGRNIRSVWSIPSEAYPGAHFATYPRKLVSPCIRAGTSEKGVCPTCGAPWERVTERGEFHQTGRLPVKYGTNGQFEHQAANRHRDGHVPGSFDIKTLGWRPTCSHTDAPIPATVFDPFCGSGTTGVVALALNRNFIGTDLSAKYLHMAERRISRPHARIARAGKHEPLPLFPGS